MIFFKFLMFSWKNSVVNDRKKWTFQIFIPKYLTLLLKLYQIYTVSLTGKSLHQLTHNMATDCSLFMKIVSSEYLQSMLCTQIVVFVLTFITILVHNMFCRCSELLKKIYLYDVQSVPVIGIFQS